MAEYIRLSDEQQSVIKTAMSEHGMSVSHLEEMADVGAESIRQWITRRDCMVDTKQFAAVAKVLGVENSIVSTDYDLPTGLMVSADILVETIADQLESQARLLRHLAAQWGEES